GSLRSRRPPGSVRAESGGLGAGKGPTWPATTVPRGAAVIEYRGKRGTVFRIKYVDGAGRQVMETVGRDRREAEAALHDRLRRVEREAYRKPKSTTFTDTFTGWFDATAVRKQWRESTRRQYRIVERRPGGQLGLMKLTLIRRADIATYVTQRLEEQAPATVSRDLTVLHSVFDWAVANELLDRNPADGVPHPKNRRRRGHALRPETIRMLARSFANT